MIESRLELFWSDRWLPWHKIQDESIANRAADEMNAIETGERDSVVINIRRIAPGNAGRLLSELEQLEAVARSYDEMNLVAPLNGREIVVIVVVVVFAIPARVEFKFRRSRYRRYCL